MLRILLLLPLPLQYNALVGATLLCSAAAIMVAGRLNRGYVLTLERNLRDRALELDLSDIQDPITRTTMLNTVWAPRTAALTSHLGDPPLRAPVESDSSALSVPSGLNPEIQDILWLRSRDRNRVVAVLRRDEALIPTLIPHVIPLLAWDQVTDEAIVALRKVASKHIGSLADALLDPYEEFAVRRRIPRVLSVCRSQRAVDSLLLGLDDIRFEVRFQCGRSLALIAAAQPEITIAADRIFNVVQKEVAVGRPVWEGRHLLDRLEDAEGASFVDEFVRMRANQSLAHVFTMLSLVLPAEPLRIALRGLHADDQHLRGTALEYLESILPAMIRDPLWPFLEDHRPAGRPVKPREDILADLLRSNQSILLNIEEIRRRKE